MSKVQQSKTLNSHAIEKQMLQNRKSMQSSTSSAAERSKLPGNDDFYAKSGKLFCKLCLKIVDHIRQGSIDRHKETASHIVEKNDSKTAITG